jgi:hypothetical protein
LKSFYSICLGFTFFFIFVFNWKYESNRTTMNRPSTKRLGILLTTLIIFSSVSFSQLDNVDFLRAGSADGLKIVQAYVSPWANAFGAGMNGSWYNTAKPHKFGGFDITTGLNIGFVPTSATTFDVSKIGLTTLSGSGVSSTIAGPKTDGQTLTASQGAVTLASFKTPPGTNWKLMPVPTAQIGLGLPFGTELKFRFIPKISIKDGSISLWGIGLVHSLMQYLPGEKLLPFDVSLFGGYSKLKGNIPMSLQPKDGAPTNYSTYNVATSFLDQKMAMGISALNIGLIASLNVPVLTLYGGLGYSKTSTEVELLGNYPLPSIDLAVSTTEGVYEDAGVIKSFPKLDIKNFSGLRANIGLRIKLSVVTIHADYTKAQYNVFSTGLGISFR